MKRRSFLFGLASALAIPSVPAIAKGLIEDIQPEAAVEPVLEKGTLIPDQWNHVAFVRNNEELRCYLNGKEVSDIENTELKENVKDCLTLNVNGHEMDLPISLRDKKQWSLVSWLQPVAKPNITPRIADLSITTGTIEIPREPIVDKSKLFPISFLG